MITQESECGNYNAEPKPNKTELFTISARNGAVPVRQTVAVKTPSVSLVSTSTAQLNKSDTANTLTGLPNTNQR